jgi:hypothetical protein
MSINIKGFDEFSKNLKKLEQKVEEIGGENQVSFAELFPDNFMSKYTNFPSIEVFFEAGNYEINSQEDLEALDEVELDNHVAQFTKFSNWEEMFKTSATEYLSKKLGF